MKKLTLIITMMWSATTLFAQSRGGQKLLADKRKTSSGFVFRYGAGYAGPMAGQIDMDNGYPLNGTYTVLSSGEYQYNVKTGSLGAGIKAMIGAEYMFNRNMGIGLNANIGLSGKKYEAGANNVDDNGVPINITTTIQAKMPIILSPGIIVQTGGNAINVYSRMGVALPVKTNFEVVDQYATLPGYGATTTMVITYQLKNSFALGYSGSLGVDFNAGDNLSLFVEANVIALSVVTKQQEMRDYVYNGVTYITQVPSNVKMVTRSKTANTTNGEYAAYSVPYSSAGISVGLALKF